MNLDALVAPLRADVVSGAAVVSRTAAEVVRRVAVRVPADDATGLRRVLGELGVRILDAQPAMAPLVSLVAGVLTALDGAEELDEARRQAARAAEAFRSEGEERLRQVARRAAAMLPEEGTVVTMSSSSTVRASLLERASPRLRIVCLESRPACEGRQQAQALAAAGLPVTVAVDAAAESLVAGAQVVLLGADSVGDAGVVNKIGSTALARAGREHGVSVLVLTDGTKLLPPGFPQPVADDRPADEVWRASAGVKVWNRYFERIPDALVELMVTDAGAATPGDVHASRRRLPVPPELAAWAEARSARGTLPAGA